MARFSSADFYMLINLSLRSALLLALLSGASALAWAQGENQDYLPLSRAELGRPFALRAVGQLAPAPGRPLNLTVGVAGAELRQDEDGNISVAGQGRDGRAWSAQLGGLCAGGASVYEADLDRNGWRDLLLFMPTCGNGLAPSSHILTLMFDANGLPVPFEAEGYFTPQGHGIFDLVDMDNDGRAELLYMNFADGYWITNLYQARDAHWQKIVGRFARHIYPLYTRFTNRPNRRAVVPRRGRQPYAPDLSNARPVMRGQFRAYQWADVNQSEDITLQVAPGADAPTQMCQPASWYGTFKLVIDDPSGRKIIQLTTPGAEFKSLLDGIIKRGAPVALYGQRQAGVCSPEILWTSETGAAAAGG